MCRSYVLYESRMPNIGHTGDQQLLSAFNSQAVGGTDGAGSGAHARCLIGLLHRQTFQERFGLA